MKALLTALLTTMSIASAQADSYVCKQRKGIDLGGGAYTIYINEIQKISKGSVAKKYDYAFKVNVKIVSVINSTTSQPLANFSTVATVEDVMYTIDALKTSGVYLRMYLDEMNESYLKIRDKFGNKLDMDLDCQQVPLTRV